MRRWLLWTFRCRRGRRCADAVFTELRASLPGAVLNIDYVCGSCRTQYRRSNLLGADGNWTSSERIRVKHA